MVPGVRIPGGWVEIRISGGGGTSLEVVGDTSFSFVVRSDGVDSLVAAVGPVDEVVRLGAAVVVSAVLAVDVSIVVDDTPDTVAVLWVGVRVVDLVVTAGGLVTPVTLAGTGLMVDLSVDVILGVTLVVTGTLCVVLMVVVRVMVVVGADVALVVDTNRVVTLSRTVVRLAVAVEEVVCSGDQDGGGGVVDRVDTSTLPVSGCVVSVIGRAVTGLTVVVIMPGGALVGIVGGVPGAPGAVGDSGVTIVFVEVVSINSAVEIRDVVLAVVAVTAADVAEVMTGLVVTVR